MLKFQRTVDFLRGLTNTICQSIPVRIIIIIIIINIIIIIIITTTTTTTKPLMHALTSTLGLSGNDRGLHFSI